MSGPLARLTAKNSTRLYPIAEVIEVHDGDTLRVRIDMGFNMLAREWIRLYDVRAPELNEPGGLTAREDLKGWLVTNAPDNYISVVTYQVETMVREIREKQTFIRYVGTVTVVENSLNAYLRTLGYIDQGK